jgi:hypothetical protein
MHAGNYTTYRTRRSQAQAAAQVQAARATAQSKAADARQTSSSAKQQAVRTVEQLEAEIARAEARLAALETELAVASERAEVGRIGELGANYEETKAALDALYGEWEQLAS